MQASSCGLPLLCILRFYFSVVKFVLIEKIYQTQERLFHHISKHLEARQKYRPLRVIFSTLFSVFGYVIKHSLSCLIYYLTNTISNHMQVFGRKSKLICTLITRVEDLINTFSASRSVMVHACFVVSFFSSMRRDVVVEVSSRGMIKTGLKSDICQVCLASIILT